MTHLIADEKLGGIQREFIEVARKAKVGDYVIFKGINVIYLVEKDPKDSYECLRIVFDADEGVDDLTGEEAFTPTLDGFTTLEPTDIVVIDGTRYRLAERKAEVGEKVLVVNSMVTMGAYRNGDVVEAAESKQGIGDGAVYVNRKFSDGSRVYLNLSEYRVLTPVDLEPSEPTPDIYDLLANLAERVTSLERIVGELVRAKTPADERFASLESQLLDAQRNIERQALELESVKKTADTALRKAISVDDRDDVTIDRVDSLAEQTEANTKDIAFLDDRTQPTSTDALHATIEVLCAHIAKTGGGR